MFTTRYALSPYIRQTRFVFNGSSRVTPLVTGQQNTRRQVEEKEDKKYVGSTNLPTQKHVD